jgi:hypothetical protein
MPDIDKLFYHVTQLQILLREREEGLHSWKGAVCRQWQIIAEMWGKERDRT